MIEKSYRIYRRKVAKLFGAIEDPDFTPPKPGPNPRVLIVFSHRSGSNLLASCVETNGLARKAVPRYSPIDLQRMVKDHNSLISASYEIADHLQQRWTRSSSKLGWRHLLLLAANGAFGPAGAYPAARTSILRIHREDTLRQSVSFVKAAQSGEWYDVDARNAAAEAGGFGTPVAEPEYTFEPERIVRRAATFEAANMMTDLVLEAIGHPVHELTYERLVADELGVMDGVRRFVDPNSTGAPIQQEAFRKQSSSLKQQWYEQASAWRETDQGQSLLADHAAQIETDLVFLKRVIDRAHKQSTKFQPASA